MSNLKVKDSEIYVVDNHDSEERISERMLGTYGITLDTYIEMYKDRMGKCDICSRVQNINDTVIDLHQDTLQDDKVIRGLLCVDCKNGLMKFGYDTFDLMRASEYVSATLFWSPKTGMTIQHIKDNHDMMKRNQEKEQTLPEGVHVTTNIDRVEAAKAEKEQGKSNNE